MERGVWMALVPAGIISSIKGDWSGLETDTMSKRVLLVVRFRQQLQTHQHDTKRSRMDTLDQDKPVPSAEIPLQEGMREEWAKRLCVAIPMSRYLGTGSHIRDGRGGSTPSRPPMQPM